MPGRPRIPLSDVRQIARMLSDCHDVGPTTRQQRSFAAEAIRTCFRAVHLTDFYMPVGEQASMDYIDPCWSSGLDEPQRSIMTDYESMKRIPTATGRRLPSENAPATTRTWRRCELVDDRSWYASDQYRRVLEPAGVDDTLRSWLPVGDDMVHVLITGRAARDRSFSDRDRALLHVTHEALQWLYQPGGSRNAVGNTFAAPAVTPAASAR